MGAPPELINRAGAAFLTEEGFGVLPDNWDALTLFLAGDSQWRYAGSVPVALDYAGVEAAARLADIPVRPDLFRQLKMIEAAAVAEMLQRLRHT